MEGNGDERNTKAKLRYTESRCEISCVTKERQMKILQLDPVIHSKSKSLLVIEFQFMQQLSLNNNDHAI